MTNRDEIRELQRGPVDPAEVARLKEQLRERARTDARNGRLPEGRVDPADLREIFTAAELVELDQLVEDSRKRQQRAREEAARRHELEAETDRVLAEQDEERRRLAEREALRRLGRER